MRLFYKQAESSERINDEHRLIYNYGDNNDLIIYADLGHYEK